MAYRRKQVWLWVVAYGLFLSLSGCASLKEAALGIAGVSTKVLEDDRREAIKKTFKYDYNTSYKKVKAALKEMGAYIYAEDPKNNLLAIYVSETDTTAVGIFFKEISPADTQLEVSSPSTYAKELIAKEVFSVLSGQPIKPQEKEGILSGKKGIWHK